MVNHGTLVKIMANHDTWNTCQDHDKIMTRSSQDLDKITMVCHGPYQGHHVRNRRSIEPFSVIVPTVSLVGRRPVYECVETGNVIMTVNNVQGIIS